MINTAPPASNSVYGSERLFWYDKINFSNRVCHCGAVVEKLLARADKPGSTPGDAVFCFFVYRFFSLSLFGLSFPKSLKYIILIQVHDQQVQGSAVRIKKKSQKEKKNGTKNQKTASPEVEWLLHHWLTDMIREIKSLEFYFGKGISKAVDLHTGQAYDQKKNHKPSRHVLPLKQLNFFQC